MKVAKEPNAVNGDEGVELSSVFWGDVLSLRGCFNLRVFDSFRISFCRSGGISDFDLGRGLACGL